VLRTGHLGHEQLYARACRYLGVIVACAGAEEQVASLRTAQRDSIGMRVEVDYIEHSSAIMNAA